MKKVYFFWLLSFALDAPAQLRLDRVALDLNLGMAFNTHPTRTFGTPAASAASLTALTRNRWVLAVEATSTGFRDRVFTQKVGLIFEGYVRYRHDFYGLRVGRALGVDSSGGRVLLTTGANLLVVDGPVGYDTGGFFFGPVPIYRTSYFVNIPVQAEYRIPFRRGGRNRAILTGRYNFNGYHSFPVFGVGMGIGVYSRTRQARLKAYRSRTG